MICNAAIGGVSYSISLETYADYKFTGRKRMRVGQVNRARLCVQNFNLIPPLFCQLHAKELWINLLDPDSASVRIGRNGFGGQ